MERRASGPMVVFSMEGFEMGRTISTGHQEVRVVRQSRAIM